MPAATCSTAQRARLHQLTENSSLELFLLNTAAVGGCRTLFLKYYFVSYFQCIKNMIKYCLAEKTSSSNRQKRSVGVWFCRAEEDLAQGGVSNRKKSSCILLGFISSYRHCSINSDWTAMKQFFFFSSVSVPEDTGLSRAQTNGWLMN